MIEYVYVLITEQYSDEMAPYTVRAILGVYDNPQDALNDYLYVQKTDWRSSNSYKEFSDSTHLYVSKVPLNEFLGALPSPYELDADKIFYDKFDYYKVPIYELIDEAEPDDLKPLDSLTSIDKNISGLSYPLSYGNEKKKNKNWFSMGSGSISIIEPAVVYENDGKIYYKESYEQLKSDSDSEKVYKTQIGDLKVTKIVEDGGQLEFPDGMCILGSFVDVFDCGPYTYAIHSQSLMVMSSFIIYRNTAEKSKPIVCKSSSSLKPDEEFSFIEYQTKYIDGETLYVMAGGYIEKYDSERHPITVIYTIKDGEVVKEIQIPDYFDHVSNMIVKDGKAYIGANKMVISIDLETKEYLLYPIVASEDIEQLS